MDPLEKNESGERRREEALARRMAEALDRISTTGAAECPDAELIAAYYEQSMQPKEMAQWEGHFAGCSRCRKILAVLVASVDAPLADEEVARLGELVAGAERPASGTAPIPVHIPAKIIQSDRFNWRARWLAPALGVAAVVAVWFAMRAPWRTPENGPSSTLIAQAPKSEPPLEQERSARELDQSSGAESKKAPESPAAVQQGRLSGNRESASAGLQSQETNPGADNKVSSQLKAKAATIEGRLDSEKESPSAISNSASGAAAATPPPAPAVPAPQAQAARNEAPAAAVTAEAMPNSPARDKQAAGGNAETAAVSAPRPAADMPLNGRRMDALSLAKNAAIAAGMRIPAPSGKVLWRASSGGKIEHSLDAGKTWVMQTSPSQQDWIAGAAASDTVCWLVGRNGSIARTTDGEHWALIPSPAAAVVVSGRFPDWTGVTANSAQDAAITSSDNRRYITADGGQTWRPQ